MNKGKVLLVLAAMTAVLAVSVSPASAFKSSVTKGTLTLISPAAVFTANSGNLVVECASLTGGTWSLATTTSLKESLAGQFTKCTAAIAGIKKTATVNSTCVLQAEQSVQDALTGTGGVLSPCTVTRGTCAVTVTTGTGTKNLGLSTVTYTKSTNGQKILSNVAGTTYTVNKGCEELEVFGGSDGTFKSEGEAFTQVP